MKMFFKLFAMRVGFHISYETNIIVVVVEIIQKSLCVLQFRDAITDVSIIWKHVLKYFILHSAHGFSFSFFLFLPCHKTPIHRKFEYVYCEQNANTHKTFMDKHNTIRNLNFYCLWVVCFFFIHVYQIKCVLLSHYYRILRITNQMPHIHVLRVFFSLSSVYSWNWISHW